MNIQPSALAILLRGQPHSGPASPASPSRSWRILIADDDEASLRLDSLVLSRAGYEVDTAADGEEAWAALLSTRYHLLLSDQQMPRLSGLELVARLRQAGMTLPVIINSGSPNLGQARDYPHLGLTAILCKPLDFAELLHAVRHVLPLAPDAAAGWIRPAPFRRPDLDSRPRIASLPLTQPVIASAP